MRWPISMMLSTEVRGVFIYTYCLRLKEKLLMHLWSVLTTIPLALGKLLMCRIGKRKPNKEDPGEFGASNNLACLWTEYYSSSMMTLEVFRVLCLVSPAINCFYSWCFFCYLLYLFFSLKKLKNIVWLPWLLKVFSSIALPLVMLGLEN